jgi:hypothetical protein
VEDIKRGECLDDGVMAAATALLCAGRTTGNVMAGQHMNPLLTKGHWVVVRSRGSSCVGSVDVEILDSLATTESWRARGVEEVCKKEFMGEHVGGLFIHQASVQQQAGVKVCGYFGIANMTEIAFSKGGKVDLSKVAFDPQQLAPHLLKCLTEGKMHRFPRLDNAAARRGVEWCKALDRFVSRKG